MVIKKVKYICMDFSVLSPRSQSSETLRKHAGLELNVWSKRIFFWICGAVFYSQIIFFLKQLDSKLLQRKTFTTVPNLHVCETFQVTENVGSEQCSWMYAGMSTDSESSPGHDRIVASHADQRHHLTALSDQTACEPSWCMHYVG